MSDLVSIASAIIAVIAIIYFLLEFQFPRAKSHVANALRSLMSRKNR
ncbi:MAG TPA: hypothetical protein VK436_10930 [Methanocella sp.]|nr:hypothetical protein [Methanocella sp.]